jgi:hypothetical protein
MLFIGVWHVLLVADTTTLCEVGLGASGTAGLTFAEEVSDS